MEFKKKTIIWEDNNEPPKNYIWVKSDGNAYEFNHTTRQWEKIMSSNESGSGDSENDEELNAFMEFFDGLDDSYKKVPFVLFIDQYNETPLPEQNELFGDKDTASYALAFKDNNDGFVAAFISDELCNKLMGWCFNYQGNDSNKNGGGFSPIYSYFEGVPFLVADKLPLLVEKCMALNEPTLTDMDVVFSYPIQDGSTSPTNYLYTLFSVDSAGGSITIIKFEEGSKAYYAPVELMPPAPLG